MPRKKLIHRKRRVIRRRYKKKQRANTRIQTLRVRSPGAVVPDRYFVKLIYYDQNISLITSPGNAHASFRYRPSAAYDVNPLFGSTAMVGFNELAALYNKYRVHGAKINIVATNQEAFSNSLTVVPLNSDPGAAPSLGTVLAWQMSPFATRKVFAAKGGMDRLVISKYMSTKKIVGSNATKYEENYASAVNTVPVDNWYFAIGVTAMGNNTLTSAGVQFDVKMVVYVEFYDRAFLTN